jgi:hypothetical protein
MLTRKSTRNTTKQIFAIEAARPAKPKNPSRAAAKAMTKNVTLHDNIVLLCSIDLFS